MNTEPNSTATADPESGSAVRVWDWPVRITHWSFALLLAAQWLTHEYDRMDLHLILGYVMLGLVVFRVYWGLAGSATARFSNFVKGPRAVAQYARSLLSRDREPGIGHNPLGGLSAVVLLSLLALQVTLGLFAGDIDGEVSGSLARYVSYGTVDDARELHETFFNVLLVFVALHIAAIVFYASYGRDDLVTPMLSGRKHLLNPVSQPTFAPAWRFWVGAMVSAAFAYWISLSAPLP